MAGGGMAARNKPVNANVLAYQQPHQFDPLRFPSDQQSKPQQHQDWQAIQPISKKQQLVSTFEKQEDSDCDLDLDSDNEEVKDI